LSVICIKVVVERKGRDESAEGSGVHDEKQRTKNRALRNSTGRGKQGRYMVVVNIVVNALVSCGGQEPEGG